MRGLFQGLCHDKGLGFCIHGGLIQMSSILLIAYGNVSRRDDGVAMHILRRLRRSLGLPAVEDDEEVEEHLTEQVAALAVHQLGPELVEDLVAYDFVVFMDAHIETPGWATIHWQEVTPAYRPSIVTHYVRPETLLALCLSLYHRCPRAYVLSVLGVDFDLGEDLSSETASRAEQAAVRLRNWLAEQGAGDFGT
jgi:hydrogenase maturation protease